MNNQDFNRGQRDASRFGIVRNVAGSWEATTTWDYQPCFLIEPVSNDYLNGLEKGGCTVVRPNERRNSKLVNRMENLLERIAYVMQ